MPQPIQPASPHNREAAAQWRSYASYVARAAGIGRPGMATAALRREATAALTGPGLRTPAAMVLHALSSAEVGAPFKPHSTFFRGEA